MLGNGIKLGTMKRDNPPARLLDLSRLISRAERVMTGVDRVERAYLDAVLADDVPAFGLIRTPIGFLLLDETGLRALAEKFDGTRPWGEARRQMSIFHSIDARHHRALSDARKLAIARSIRRGLGRMLKRHLPKGSAYINVGHTNLTDYVTRGVKALAGATISVMVHDTIPLDWPDFQREGSPERFKLFLSKVAQRADLVIYNSAATQADAERHMAQLGRVPRGMVAHLGVELPRADPSGLPKYFPPEEPYFVCVSTLEPRKNHLLLVDVWEQIEKQTPPQDMPHLIICGTRGWKNDELFFRLDGSRLKGRFIHELSGLDDGAMAALVEGAAGAAFPSFAEGYGLPVFEALARGTPVICADLPVYREVARDIPVYASLNDSYLWIRRVMSLAESKRAGRKAMIEAFDAPSWDAHFNLVLSET